MKRLILNDRGMAMVTALIIMLFVIPLVGTFLTRAINEHEANVKDRQIKTARVLANNVLVDFMRQFSQDHYDGHYDSTSLARCEAFYSVGYSTVSIEADTNRHTVFLRALGKYGQDSSNPKFTKKITGLIQFISDLTRFGSMINGAFTITGSNVIYTGGMYTNGAMTISGSNVTFNGGAVISNGNHTGSGTTTHNADVYYLGSCSGGTYNGARYSYVPDVDWPTINTTYYSQRYHYRTTANQTWNFSVVGGSGTFNVVGTTTVVTIPASGAILFTENNNLTVYGTVRGRVIIVCSGTLGSTTQGCITVSGNLRYANGTNLASAQDSLALMAKNRITFTAPNIVVNGIYFVEQAGTTQLQGTSSGTGSFSLYGVRCSGLSSYYSSALFQYDPNLVQFPPPGLPEKPFLVMWRVEG
ncbi:MAG TPA: hypothetical protein PK876_00050 [Elusimicrobiota bacterium]|nr:hypothetical protein [Elusimicrobiota bacterium]